MERGGDPELTTRRARRHAFLTMVARRQRPGAGSILSALDGGRTVLDWWLEADGVLASVPHAVVGAVATNAYAPERLTRDLDLAILAGATEQAHAALRAAGWELQGRLGGIRGTAWRNAHGQELDLLELHQPWAEGAIREAQQNQLLRMPTLTRPYLVYMKLMAARTTDLGDVSRMLGRASRDEIRDARAVVAQWGSTADLADFDQLVQLGQLERSGDGDDGSDRDPAI